MSKLLNHPGEKLKLLSDENYRLRRELLITRQRAATLKHRLDMAQKELSLSNFNITAIPPIPMTKQVSNWICEFDVPWQVLYCPDCNSWFIELDNSFPYHLENCMCRCDEKGEIDA